MSNTSPSSHSSEVYDLRSAIELLKQFDGEYIETDEPVNPEAELSGVYRYVGAGSRRRISKPSSVARCTTS